MKNNYEYPFQDYKNNGLFKSHADVQYLRLAKRILEHGAYKEDRTGTGTLSIFAPQMRFDLQKGFPLLTTKKVFTKGVVEELAWFISGNTNIRELLLKGVNIWNGDAYRMYKRLMDKNEVPKLTIEEYIERIKTDVEFALDYGDLGKIYGKQWRSWEMVDTYFEDYYEIDQLYEVVEKIKKDPNSRRLIVSAWNVGELDQMALPPCHTMYQFYVVNGKLSCQLYQRSADVFLGIPFNIASYALLTHLVAHETGLEVGELVITFGDAHIYSNHIEQIKEQMSRMPRELPVLYVNEETDIFNFKAEDIEIEGYNPHPAIKGKVSVGV